MRKLLFSLCFVAAAALCGGCAPQTTPDPQVERVILMIGDGMGVPHVTDLILNSPEGSVNMERAHSVGLVKTHSANNRVTDSAAAGTAIASGTKTDNNRLGRDPGGRDLKSILTRAQEAGYPAGIVVTVDLFDATPGAFYAHVHSRKSRDTISVQLLGSGIDVAMGGGLVYMENRADGRDLPAEFAAKGYNVALDFGQTAEVSEGQLLAVLAPEILPYYVDGRGEYLPGATNKALEILTNNAHKRGSRGFFLMVEGSLIDYAAHDNLTRQLIGEVQDFDRAVGRAFDYADRHPGTLVIVTADHETGGLTMPSGDSDFSASDSGVEYRYSTDSHTASLVPLFAYGAGASHFSRVLDNTELSKIIARLLGIE